MCVDYRTEETKLLAALNIAESLETIGIADNRADERRVARAVDERHLQRIEHRVRRRLRTASRPPTIATRYQRRPSTLPVTSTSSSAESRVMLVAVPSGSFRTTAPGASTFMGLLKAVTRYPGSALGGTDIGNTANLTRARAAKCPSPKRERYAFPHIERLQHHNAHQTHHTKPCHYHHSYSVRIHAHLPFPSSTPA